MTDGREITSSRVFNAPRELAWRAWTEPEHLSRWWGPKGFTNTFHEFEPKPGGTWRFTMHGPDGADYHNQSVFIELAKPERIVFDHLMPMHRFRATAGFSDVTGKTKIIYTMRFESVEECDRVKVFVVQGNEQNFDRLEAELEGMK